MKNIKTLESGNRDEKLAYIFEAADQCDVSAVEPLINALSTEKDLLYEIIWSLGKIGDPLARDAVLKFINNDDDRIRGASAEALGEIGSKTQPVIDELVSILNDTSDRVHWQASWALGKLGDKNTAKILIEKLDNHNFNNKWHYVHALGMIGNECAVSSLTSMLGNDLDINMKRNVVFALKNILDPESQATFEKFQNDNDSEVRHYANEAIMLLHDNISE